MPSSFIPHFFIWNSVGAGINEYIKASDEFSLFNLIMSEEVYIPLITFIVLILFSFLIKKKFFND